jgi:hypothetical protein
MEKHLQAINPHLMWEFGPAAQGQGHRLVITPESKHPLRPLVRAILERAPKMDGWEFYEHRLAENLDVALMAVQGRTGLDVSGFKVRASRGGEHRIDLTYQPPANDGLDESAALNAAFVATEALLGERCLDNWIGAIEIAARPRASGIRSLFGRAAAAAPQFLELNRLNDTVQALIESIRDQLPPTPHCDWIERAQWTMWKLKPQESDEYCGQHDLFVAKSANPDLWTAAHSDRLFSSERFSRCDEIFCYLKLDGAEGLDEAGFADKAEIEDALDAALKPGKLGCHIGGGTGLRYSYIDLALLNAGLGATIEMIRHRLRQGKVPKRSWIQFFDSDLAAEWVGIYDGSPPPPLDFD